MQSVRVASVRRETPEIISLDLVAMNGDSLPDAPPGSHIDVATGPRGTLLRQYSLCQAPAERHLYRVGIKREQNSRGGSQWLHESVREGDELCIGLPRDNFPPAKEAGMHILVAGGIGITPMLSMAQHLHEQGSAFRLEYFVRSMEHAAFASALQQAPFRDNVRFHIGVPGEALPALAKELFGTRPTSDAHLYFCGPAPFMAAIEEVARPGWPAAAVHREYFGAATGQSAANGSFRIRLARSGQELLVPEGIPIIAVLEASGVALDTSCRQGACGTCMVNVLEGKPDHRDSFLLPEEREEGSCIVTCVSRSLSPMLVLDL